jgi:triose/dihydroxyacetone kinase / FAD-AMP lyase (cyclizing)
MSTKHFCSDASHLVTDSLRSLTRLNPPVRLEPEHKVVVRSGQEIEASTVNIVSGGGSGHEPAFGAYVGEGMLAAAVAGTIFASPNWKQILYAIESVDAAKGVLVTAMNYTGDVLNFGVAVEKAKARNPKLAIEMLVVGDDAGVPRQKAGRVGRRGIAGIVLVHKITGAAAAAGMSLSDVVKLGRLVCDNLASIGVSLGRVHVPGRGQGDKEGRGLGNDEVELGMGIHNEPGSGRRTGEQAKLPALIQEMLKQLLGADDEERSFLPKGVNKVVLLLNNLGGLSVLELGAITS